jgi:hypothetical protein
MATTVRVTINKNNLGIYVDQDPARASARDVVEWAYADSEFVIYFPDGSPFPTGDVFRSHANVANPGPVPMGIGNKRKVYKYIVITDDGGAIDPGVIIH